MERFRTTYGLNRIVFLGKQLLAIVDTIRSETSRIISVSLDNGILSREFGNVKLSKDRRGNIVFSINGSNRQNLEGEGSEQEIDNIILELTKKLQLYYLRKELEIMIKGLAERGLELLITEENNGPNIEFQIQNINYMRRSVTIYMDDGDSQYDFADTSISEDELDRQIENIDVINIDTIEKWLRGESLLED